MSAPVMYDASSNATNRTTLATSSGFPSPRNNVRLAMSASSDFGILCRSGDALEERSLLAAGADAIHRIALTRMVDRHGFGEQHRTTLRGAVGRGEEARSREADPRTGTRDDGDLVSESHARASRIPVWRYPSPARRSRG